MQDHRPTPDSLNFRADLSRLLSPLRRVRPRVPFFQLAAHRIPTLWSLYRGLLKEAPTDDIKFRVRMLFHEKRHLTGTDATKKYLVQGYKFLDAFKRANAGDARQQAILSRYSRLIGAKAEKEYWNHLARKELAWRNRLRNRPIMTGAYLRPSESNPPLPRLVPQPLAITRIIGKRRKIRQKRIMALFALEEEVKDIKREAAFEEGLQKLVGGERFSPVFGGDLMYSWLEFAHLHKKHLTSLLEKDEVRKNMRYEPEMLAAIKAARREKIANKTRELTRERRGEVLRRTILRRNKGPPAHILARMTPEQRRMDKISRSVSEVGYVAQVKRKLGFKLRNPDAWKAENGGKECKKTLDEVAKEIEQENLRRIAAQNEHQ